MTPKAQEILAQHERMCAECVHSEKSAHAHPCRHCCNWQNELTKYKPRK